MTLGLNVPRDALLVVIGPTAGGKTRLAIELATFPPEALDASVLQVALGFATSFDVSPVLLAAPRELARAAVEAAIAESGDDPPEVLTDLRVRLA